VGSNIGRDGEHLIRYGEAIIAGVARWRRERGEGTGDDGVAGGVGMLLAWLRG
jgi:hypothetical protein